MDGRCIEKRNENQTKRSKRKDSYFFLIFTTQTKIHTKERREPLSDAIWNAKIVMVNYAKAPCVLI